MSSRPLVILGVIIIVIAIIAAAGYLVNGRGNQASTAPTDSNTADSGSSSASSSAPDNVSPTFYQSTSTTDSSANSSPSSSSANPASSNGSNGSAASLASSIPFPGSSTIAMASWVTYTDAAGGYSLSRPAGMTQNVIDGNQTFLFPKNSYFHWPLLDDARITVTVGPSCPAITAGDTGNGPASFSLNGYAFTRTVGTDVGAGQRYLEVAYDTKANGVCYHVDFLDHGTNGAGFYVDDAALIKRYDAQHAVDQTAVLSALNGIVGSFRLLAPAH